MLRRQPPDPHAGDDDFDRSFGRKRRVRTAAEFAALLQAPRAASIRAARRFLAVIAACKEINGVDSTPRTRFGVIVGRRAVRRAVDRALAKRIVREACRFQASAFERCAALAAVRVDVVLRLKSPLVDATGRALAMRQWRRQLRSEADDLLQHVLSKLTASGQRADE